MNCPNCKSNIPDDSKFCPDCGTPVVNTEEIRTKAKEIVSKYKEGYNFFVSCGTLPRLVYNSTVENCEMIIAKKTIIINKHEEIVLEKKRPEAKQIHDSYKKGYDNLASRGIIPYYTLNYSSVECDKIISNRSLIIQTHNKIVEDERRRIFEKQRRESRYETFRYADGSRYEGYVVNGVRQGKGTYYYSNGGRYVGDWLNDKRHGKGTDYYNNGDRYEGDFKNDKREGRGTYFWSNGSFRSNEWKNDVEIVPSVITATSEYSAFDITITVICVLAAICFVIGRCS